MTRFRLERRERTPVLVQLLVPVAALLVALVLCSGLVRLAGTGILHAYGLLFLSTFQTAYDIEDTLIKAAPPPSHRARGRRRLPRQVLEHRCRRSADGGRGRRRLRR